MLFRYLIEAEKKIITYPSLTEYFNKTVLPLIKHIHSIVKKEFFFFNFSILLFYSFFSFLLFQQKCLDCVPSVPIENE